MAVSRVSFFALAAAFLIGSPAIPSTAYAVPAEPGSRLGFHLGGDQFEWQEWDPADSSRKILKESGPRFRGAITWDNFMRPSEGGVYALDIQGYYGRVDYDGETQTGAPLKTDVDYAGGLAEGRLGYRFEIGWTAYGLDILGGLGYESWTRDIKDGRLEDGTRVQGYEEQYGVTYARLGLALADLSETKWFGRLEAGVRYPLSVDETVGEPINATLHPRRDTSLYVTYEITRTPYGAPSVGVTLFYDSLSLKESPVGSSDIGPVLQPKSEMKVSGIRLGVYF